MVYAIALVMIDKFYEARIKRFREVQELEQQTRAAEEAAVRAAQPEPVADGEEMVVHKEATPEYRPVFKELLEHGAAILVAFTAVAQLAAVWGVEMGDEGNPVTAALGTLAIVFIAYLAYKAVNLYVDRQLEGEDIGGEPGEPGEEMSGTGATRL
ncbi:MAG: hypothetical protein GWO02_07520, partial [Gammaproteobacteria bacterium]|nr:hypothetical protein [Gammaproteobacteria bacterium]